MGSRTDDQTKKYSQVRAFMIGRFINKTNHKAATGTKEASFLETFSINKGIKNRKKRL